MAKYFIKVTNVDAQAAETYICVSMILAVQRRKGANHSTISFVGEDLMRVVETPAEIFAKIDSVTDVISDDYPNAR